MPGSSGSTRTCRGVEDGDVAPGGVGEHQRALGDGGRARVDHPADGAALHGLADLPRGGVGLPGVHPAAHVRVDRHDQHPDDDLPVRRVGVLDLDQPEVLGGRLAVRPGRQLPFTCRQGHISDPAPRPQPARRTAGPLRVGPGWQGWGSVACSPAHAGRALRRSARLPVRAAVRRGRRRRRRARCGSPTSTRARRTARPSCCCTASRPGRSCTGRMIPVLVGRRAARGRPGPGRLRPLGQAGRAGRLHATPGTSTGCGRRCSTSSTSRDVTLVGQDWGGLIGLRLVARAPRPLRPGRRRQHRPADRRPADARGVPGLAAVLAGEPDVPRSAGSSTAAAPHRCRPRWWPPTTRPSPTTATRPARGAFPALRAHRRPTTRPRRPTAPPGRCSRRWDKPFLTAFSDGDPITARRRRGCSSKLVPGAQGMPHTTLAGGGHFLPGGRRPGARPRRRRPDRRDPPVTAAADFFAQLRRAPDVEAPELVAVDATDRLLLDEAAAALALCGPGEVAVVDDTYGALTLGAVALHGASDVRVAQDLLVGERALARNAERTGLAGHVPVASRSAEVAARRPGRAGPGAQGARRAARDRRAGGRRRPRPTSPCSSAAGSST